MAEQPLEGLIKQEPLGQTVGQLVKEIREAKGLSQSELGKKTDIARQNVSEIENGRIQRVDLEKLRAIINACGETLFITSSYANPRQVTDRTEQEDVILKAFAAGEIEEANEKLNQIRNWSYPSSYLNAQCKRNMAIAISYHFNDMKYRSQMRMNDLLMGLSFIGCHSEAERYTEMYHRIIKEGERALDRSRGKEA